MKPRTKILILAALLLPGGLLFLLIPLGRLLWRKARDAWRGLRPATGAAQADPGLGVERQINQL